GNTIECFIHKMPPKFLMRAVTLLLIPSSIGDPALAAALSGRLFTECSTPAETPSEVSSFDEQALAAHFLSERLTWQFSVQHRKHILLKDLESLKNLGGHRTGTVLLPFRIEPANCLPPEKDLFATANVIIEDVPKESRYRDVTLGQLRLLLDAFRQSEGGKNEVWRMTHRLLYQPSHSFTNVTQ